PAAGKPLRQTLTNSTDGTVPPGLLFALSVRPPPRTPTPDRPTAPSPAPPPPPSEGAGAGVRRLCRLSVDKTPHRVGPVDRASAQAEVGVRPPRNRSSRRRRPATGIR